MSSSKLETDDIVEQLEGLKLGDDYVHNDSKGVEKSVQAQPPALPSKQESSQRDGTAETSPNEQTSATNEHETTPTPSLDQKDPSTVVVEEVSSLHTSDEARRQVSQTIIRFRRPVLTTDPNAPMQDSYEALTLSELQQLDPQLDADAQLQMEELQLALGDFEETDEFEEVDEFEEDDNWEGVGVDAEWDGDEDVYCGGEDCEEEFLDDRE